MLVGVTGARFMALECRNAPRSERGAMMKRTHVRPLIHDAIVGCLGKYFIRQPNRAFLRKLGFSRSLGAFDRPVSTAELRAAGVREHWVKWLSREERICSSNAAVYIYRGKVTDRLERMARWHPAMTAGLTTALWLGDVLPERPTIDHWMIDEAKRRPIWLPPDVSVHRSRHAMDDTFEVVRWGEPFRAHLPLCAVLDCVRFRDELGHSAVLSALKFALASRAVDLQLLLFHAKRTKVCKPLLRILGELSVDLSLAAGA